MSGTLTDTYEYANAYVEKGWALVAIPAGSKAPTSFGWQTKATPADYWKSHPTHNIGILHSLSGTCALDIDHMDNTRTICEALNIDLDAILQSAPRIVGRPDRGKVLFRVPEGDPLSTRKISWPVDGDPRRTEVVFELRAGSVQDVLPPSIHPDTEQPYTWAGKDWREELPPIPDQLLTIWREWDRFRPQLMDACPWKRAPSFTPPPSKRLRTSPEGGNVIQLYNNATPIAEALEKAGYRQIGSRWLSPNSSTNMPGVIVFDDGRAFSHHASDPFDPSHSFDAFDVFCHYEHLGNVSNAVKAAADLLDVQSLPEGPSELERDMQKHGGEVWESWQKKKDGGLDDIPKHLLTVPGVLGDVVKYAARRSVKPQPQFDVQAALALGSVVMGRRFVTDHRNMSGLYFLNVGKTGTGKENANTVISALLTEAGLSNLYGPAGYTSEGGVLSALRDEPCHVSIIDEFGNYLKAASMPSSANLKQAFSMLMETWGRQNGILQSRGYSTVAMTEGQRKSMQIRVHHPSLTILAMTTPGTFYDAISYKDAASGFLNRILTVESKLPYMRSKKPSMQPAPEKVLDWMRAAASAQAEGAGNLSDIGAEFPPEPVLIPFSAAAQEILDDMEGEIINLQNAAADSTEADMMNRSREIAMRLSLIVAHSLGDREITSSALQWAIDYTTFYSRRMIDSLSDNMAEGDTDGLRKKVAASIKKAGTSGVKISELIKSVPKLGNLKKHERDGLLAMVVEDYPIERLSVKPEGGKGRPSIIHRWEA